MALFFVPYDGRPEQEVKSSASFPQITDYLKEAKLADALYSRGIEAQTILTDNGVLVSGDRDIARRVGNVVATGLFEDNTKSALDLNSAFGKAANVVQFRQPALRPSIMGGYGQPALAA